MATMPNRAIEILRRVALGGGLAAAAWLAFLTDLRPSISVFRDPSLSRPSDAGTPVPRVEVSGPEWQAFFANAHASFAGNYPVSGWEWRIPAREFEEAARDNTRRGTMSETDRLEEAESVQRLKEQYGIDTTFRGSFTRLYFDADEPPFPSLPAGLTDFEPVELVLAGANTPIRIERAPAHEFVEFSDVNPMPMRFKHRWRHVAWWPLVGGLLVYAALPWFRPRPNQLAYQRWRIVLGDFASSLMWGGFFLLPLGVIGGSVEAVTVAPILTAIVWGLALLGAYSYYWAARHASYLLELRDGGCELFTLSGHESIAWADIRTVEGVQITPPRWFIRLNFLAVLLGGSAAGRLGQAGRALMIAGSRVNGLRLTGRNGSVRHIWVSDQMGGKAMANVDALMDAIGRAGVEQPKDIVQLKALFPPA